MLGYGKYCWPLNEEAMIRIMIFKKLLQEGGVLNIHKVLGSIPNTRKIDLSVHRGMEEGKSCAQRSGFVLIWKFRGKGDEK